MKDSIKFCKYDKFGKLWKKCGNFNIFLGQALSRFFSTKNLSSKNLLKFQMHVTGDAANKFC